MPVCPTPHTQRCLVGAGALSVPDMAERMHRALPRALEAAERRDDRLKSADMTGRGTRKHQSLYKHWICQTVKTDGTTYLTV
eukprot:2234476-Rhodomonas_salina.1